MVAVAIQPNTSAMRAQGRTFILAILLKKVFTDKDFIMIVLQTFLGFQQRTETTIWSNKFHLPR